MKAPAQGGDPLVREIRSYGVGIDTHSRFIQVCVLRNNGGNAFECAEAKFGVTWDALADAHRWTLDRVGALIKCPSELAYVIESTGCYHIPVLMAFEGIPSIVNPVLAGPTRRKTDVLDARLLAHHGVTGVWPPSFLANSQLHVLRMLVGQFREARRASLRVSNRVNNFLLRFGHNLTVDGTIGTKRGRAIVEDLIAGRCKLATIHPEGLPAESIPWFTACLASHEASQKQHDEYIVKAIEYVRGRAWPGGDGHGGSVTDGSGLIDLLATVPGVSETVALTWVAEIGDPFRFQNARQVAAFIGSDPSVKVSAGKVTSTTRRKGNERLHYSLLRAAGGRMLATACPLGAWGRSIRGRHKKGGYRKATSAIARRIGVSLWHVHRLGVAYDPTKYTFGLRPTVPDVPIEEMGLGRAERVLREYGITTSGQVLDAYYDGMATLKGVGEACLNAVRSWLEKTGKRTSSRPPDSRSSGSG